MTRVIVRRATQADAAALARLTTHLGYPVSEAVLLPRVERQLSSDKDLLLVATTVEGAVVGWIHGFLCQLLESAHRVEIGGLIVDEQHRRQGVGRRLVREVERWALERGAEELSVRCRVERADSHRFYTEQGFRGVKTQQVFRKSLAAVVPANP